MTPAAVAPLPVDDSGGHGVRVTDAAGAVWHAPAPVALLYRAGTGERRLAAGYDAVERGDGGLLGRAVVVVPGEPAGRFLVEDRYTADATGVVIDRRVTVEGTFAAPVDFASELTLRPVPGAGAAEPRWLLPGALYGRNERAPAGAILADLTAATGLIRADRLALPLLARWVPDAGRWASLLHLDAQASTVDDDDTAADLVGAGLRFGAFGGPGGDELTFRYPGGEGPTSYPPMWTIRRGNLQFDSPVCPFRRADVDAAASGWAHRWHPARAGVAHRYRLLLSAGTADGEAAFIRAAWRAGYARYAPPVRPVDLSAVEAASLALLSATVVTDDGGAVGVPTWIDCFGGGTGRVQDTFSGGFVGRNLEVAYALLVGAERFGEPRWREQAEAIVAFWLSHGGPGGLCHTDYDRATRRWVDAGSTRDGAAFVYLRDQTEAHAGVLRAAVHEAAHGRPRPDWLTWCRSYGDWLLRHRNADGTLSRAYRLDGTIAADGTNDGVHAVTYLAELAEATGEAGYASAAVELGEVYWRRYHERLDFYGGTLDNPNCADREAATVALEAYLALHRTTGERRWLAAATVAADIVETWLVCWDIPMGAAHGRHVFYDERAGTVGLSLITLGFSAVDNYLSRHVGDLLALERATGDPHYGEVARLALHNTKRTVQIAGEYGYARDGMQIEHWSLGRGRGYGLNSGWLPWVSTSHLLGIWASAAARPLTDPARALT